MKVTVAHIDLYPLLLLHPPLSTSLLPPTQRAVHEKQQHHVLVLKYATVLAAAVGNPPRWMHYALTRERRGGEEMESTRATATRRHRYGLSV